MADIQTECKTQLGDLSKIPAHEFEKHFQDWMERDDVARALQAKMRYDLIRSFNKTALGQQIVSQTTTTTSGGAAKRLKLSPLILALNTLVAEFLYAENCHFALSVFCTEVPYRNTLPDFESQRHFRFAEAEVFEIIEAISAPAKPEATFTQTVTKDYVDNNENSLLLLVLKVLLGQIDKPVMKLRDVSTSVEADDFAEPTAAGDNGPPPPAPAPPPPPPESPRYQSDSEAHMNRSNFRNLNKYLITLSKKVKVMSQQFQCLQETNDLLPAVKTLPRPRAVQTLHARRYEKLNRSLERITDNLRKMSHAKRRSKHVSSIVSAIGGLSTQFSKCALNFENVSKQLLETRKQGSEERLQAGANEVEAKKQERSYTDWVHEMRHTKNGQKFLERVECSLRKALAKQKELLRTEADLRMQHQKELLKIRYKHKVMQHLSKHPVSDLCGEAQRLNESIEYQLREFEARHGDLLQKMHGAEDEMKTAVKSAAKTSSATTPDAIPSEQVATKADTAPASAVASGAMKEAANSTARTGASDVATSSTAAKAIAMPADETTSASCSGVVNVRAAGGSVAIPSCEAFAKDGPDTAGDKFVQVVKAKMRQTEIEKLEKLSTKHTPVSSSPNIIINLDCGLISEKLKKQMPSAVTRQSALHKQVRSSVEIKATPPAPPSTPTKSSCSNLRDATVGQNHLQQMMANYAEPDHSVDAMVWNAKLRLQELEFESNQLEQNFRSYLERQRIQTATVNETMASLMKANRADRNVTEESHKIIEQLRAMAKRKSLAESPPDDMTSVSSPECPACRKPALSTNNDNVYISKVSSTVQFRNAILEAKEKLFKRELNWPQQITVPPLNLHNVPSQTETQAELSECLSAVEAYYYNRNFGRIESRSNFRAGETTSKATVESSAAPLQPVPMTSAEANFIANQESHERDSQELRPRLGSRKSPKKFKRQLQVSEKSSTTSMAAATVAKAMALAAASAIADAESTRNALLRNGRNDVGVGCDGRTDVAVGTDRTNDVGVGTDDLSSVNKDVNKATTARRTHPEANDSNNSDSSSNTKSSSSPGCSGRRSDIKEKVQHEKRSGDINNRCKNELNCELQQQQHKQLPVVTQKQSDLSIGSAQSAPAGVVACTSTTSLLSATSMVLQQSMARMYQLFAEAPIAKGRALELGNVVPDAGVDPEQWRRNVEELQSIVNNNAVFERLSAAGPAAAGSGVEREIASTSSRVNNNNNNNKGTYVAQQQTIARLPQQQQEQQSRAAPMQSSAAGTRITPTTPTTTTTTIKTKPTVTATIKQQSVASKDNNAMKIAADCSPAADCKITKSEKLPGTDSSSTVSTLTNMPPPAVESTKSLATLPTITSSTTFCMQVDNLERISQTSINLEAMIFNDEMEPQLAEEEEEDEEEEEVEEEQQPMGAATRPDSTRTVQTEPVVSSSPSLDLQLSVGSGGGQSDSGSDFW